MSKEPITPMGGSTLDPTKGLQERNLDTLLKIFSKKEATEAITAIGKMEANTWIQVRDTVRDLKDVVAMGGVGTIVDNLTESIQLRLDQAMAPINNQLSSIVTDTLGPIYADLQALATDMAAFVADGPTGAFWGSMVGSIWGELGQLMGGLIGAGVEQGIILLAIWWRDEWPKFLKEVIGNIKEWWKDVDIISKIGEAFTEWYLGIVEDIAPGATEFIRENRPIWWPDAEDSF